MKRGRFVRLLGATVAAAPFAILGAATSQATDEVRLVIQPV